MDPQQSDVQIRRVSAEDARLNTLLNDVAKRVHTVIDAVIDRTAAGRPTQELTAAETQAVFNGAVSGIAALCSMMRFEVKPGKDGTTTAPEEELGDKFRLQFISSFRFYQHQMAVQTAAELSAEGRKPS